MLRTDTLGDLLVLNTDKIELEQFSPDSAINRWWDAKTRRPSQGPRKEYKKRSRHQEAENSTADDVEEDQIILDDWDEWLQVESQSD